jgi:predicted amidohydrolase
MTATNTAIDKSRLFKRAWYLTKNKYGSFAYNLKKVWAEMKEAIKERISKIEMAITPEYTGCNWTPSAKTMAAYYNSSCYKGD